MAMEGFFRLVRSRVSSRHQKYRFGKVTNFHSSLFRPLALGIETIKLTRAVWGGGQRRSHGSNESGRFRFAPLLWAACEQKGGGLVTLRFLQLHSGGKDNIALAQRTNYSVERSFWMLNSTTTRWLRFPLDSKETAWQHPQSAFF